ncbi:MAG: hypothetical protein GYA14_15380 [Ignavibacteria bacterium]|nr:hypothetical protein [Ignavibacteria bacterium]
MKNILIKSFLSLIFCLNLYGQANLVPINNRIYDFLERMTVKDALDFNSFFKPISRKEIAAMLHEIEPEKLSDVEKEELIYLKQEFNREIISIINPNQNFNGKLNLLWAGSTEDRLNLLDYNSPHFNFTFNPILGLSVRNIYDELQLKRWWGFSFYGDINDFSFQGDFRDNWEQGDNLDKDYRFNDKTGPIILKSTTNTIEYSETRGAVLYSNEWMTIGAVKELFNLGSGYRSQLVLSQKAPSFPSIYLKLAPVEWLQFNYLHGWLISRIEDTLLTYKTFIQGRDRRIYRDKYFVMHDIQIKPFSDLTLNLGETVIYSDNGVYWGYLIPFLFFRSVDHMFEGGGGSNAGNNGSLFFDINYKFLSKFKTYFSVFIDELSLSDLLDGSSDRNQFAYSIGLHAYDFGISNLGARIEYSRILPWVYSNFVQTQTYTNSNYLLGHYIGQNSDQLFLQLDYRLLRGLEFKFWGEMIRRGGFDDVANQYTDPGEPFLYGLRRNETNLGLEITYEYIHDLSGRISYQYSDITDEDALRTPEFMMGRQHSFSVGFYYGL